MLSFHLQRLKNSLHCDTITNKYHCSPQMDIFLRKKANNLTQHLNLVNTRTLRIIITILPPSLTSGVLSSSYFLIEFIYSKCLYLSSNSALFCSLVCSFCCVAASSSRNQAFSCTNLLTCARNFCFSASTMFKWCPSAIITCIGRNKETKRNFNLISIYEYDLHVTPHRFTLGLTFLVGCSVTLHE